MINAKTSLLLAIAFLLLGGIAFFDSVKWSEERKSQDGQERKILSVRDTHVDWIEIAYPRDGQNKHFKFHCLEAGGCTLASNSHWEISEPAKIDADSVQIGSMLATLAEMRFNAKVSLQSMGARDWRKEFGLTTPALHLTIQFHGQEKSLLLDFGDFTVVGHNSYLYHSRDVANVYAVPDYILRTFDRDLYHWRNKQLFPGVATDAIKKIIWKSSVVATPFTAEKQEQDWYLTQPQSVRADSLLLAGLAATLANWSAKTIPDSAPTKKASGINLQVDFFLKDGKKYSLEIWQGKAAGQFFAKSSARDWYAELNTDEVNKFIRTFPEYRDPQLLSRSENRAIRKFVIAFSDKKFEFTLAPDGNWRAEGTMPLASDKVRNFLSAFFAPEVREMITLHSPDAQSWRQGKPFTVMFQDETGKQIQKFQVWTNHKDRAIVSGELPGELRRMTPKFAAKMPAKIEDFR